MTNKRYQLGAKQRRKMKVSKNLAAKHLNEERSGRYRQRVIQKKKEKKPNQRQLEDLIND
jgi:hypothetical protein